MKWGIFAVLSVLFFITPYERGLFFDSDMYWLEIFIGALLLISITWMWIRHSDWIKLTDLVIFLLPVPYILSLTVAESVNGDMKMIFRWIMYCGFMLILTWVKKDDKISKTLPFVFQVTGLWIAFYALLGYWGYVQFQDIVMKDNAVGDMLTGFFQYHNTFAVIIGAFWLYALVASSEKWKRSWVSIIFSFSLSLYGTTFFLAESRGALVFLPVAWFIGLIFHLGKKQLQYILNTIISLGGSFYSYRMILAQKKAGVLSTTNFIEVILIAVIATVIMFVIHLLINYILAAKLEWMGRKKYFQFVIPVLSVIGSLLLFLDLKNQGFVFRHLPTTLQERISSISLEAGSAVARTTYMHDAWRMSKDAPFLGHGGNSWSILFTKYQQQPYWSTQIHNGYSEVLLNTGWIGLLMFVLVLCFLLLQIIRRIIKENDQEQHLMTLAVLPSLIFIFAHAFMDFDFSYGSVWLIIFWLFAMGMSQMGSVIKEDDYTRPWIGKVILSIMAIVVVIFSFKTFSFYLSDQDMKSIQPNQTPQETQKHYEQAYSDNPNDVTNLLKMASFYGMVYQQTPQQDIKQRIITINQSLEALEPNNSQVLSGIANNLLGIGDSLKSVDYLDKAIQVDRYNVKLYDEIIYVKSSLAIQYMKIDKNKAMEMAKSSINDYDNFVKLTSEFKKNPIQDMRPLDLATQTYFYVGQSNLILNQYQKALDMFGQVTENVNPQIEKQTDAGKVVALDGLGKHADAINVEQETAKKFDGFSTFVNSYKNQLNSH